MSYLRQLPIHGFCVCEHSAGAGHVPALVLHKETRSSEAELLWLCCMSCHSPEPGCACSEIQEQCRSHEGNLAAVGCTGAWEQDLSFFGVLVP